MSRVWSREFIGCKHQEEAAVQFLHTLVSTSTLSVITLGPEEGFVVPLSLMGVGVGLEGESLHGSHGSEA